MNDMENSGFIEKRQGPRKMIEDYYSVEFQIKGTGPIYHFKLRDESGTGLSILIKQDSGAFSGLKVDDVLDMNYYTDKARLAKTLRTKIVHITRQDSGRFAGHFIIGLAQVPV
jgi:hypothetical protein